MVLLAIYLQVKFQIRILWVTVGLFEPRDLPAGSKFPPVVATGLSTSPGHEILATP